MTEPSTRSSPYLLAARQGVASQRAAAPTQPKQINAPDIRQACPIFTSDEIVHIYVCGFRGCKISTIKKTFHQRGTRPRQTPYLKFIGDVLIACAWKSYLNILNELIPQISNQENFKNFNLTVNNEEPIIE